MPSGSIDVEVHMGKGKALTPTGIAVLALLKERPMHPYEMVKTLLDRHEDLIIKVRTGTLYHTVERLAEQELLAAVSTDREGNRPERTRYEITDAGRDRLDSQVADLLSTVFEECPRFPQGIAEAHNLPAEVVVERLETRLEALRAKVALLETGIDTVRQLKLAERLWLDIDYLYTMHKTEYDWITDLLERVRSGQIDWESPCHGTDDHSTRKLGHLE